MSRWERRPQWELEGRRLFYICWNPLLIKRFVWNSFRCFSRISPYVSVFMFIKDETITLIYWTCFVSAREVASSHAFLCICNHPCLCFARCRLFCNIYLYFHCISAFILSLHLFIWTMFVSCAGNALTYDQIWSFFIQIVIDEHRILSVQRFADWLSVTDSIFLNQINIFAETVHPHIINSCFSVCFRVFFAFDLLLQLGFAVSHSRSMWLLSIICWRS